jgi:hypothetical protein
MNTPNIVFSKWTRWAARTDLDKIIESPGVYVLAHFATPPPGNANPQTREIIYIGETCARTLKERWNGFHRAAFGKGKNHSGGKKYQEKCGGNGNDLFVAAFPVVELNEELRPLFIRYVERKLIWKYSREHLAPPECNRK